MKNLYHRHRFPAEIISYCVWLYNSFSLSYPDIEKMMLDRGVGVHYEAIRYWCRKFSQTFANQIRRPHPKPGHRWYLDSMRSHRQHKGLNNQSRKFPSTNAIETEENATV